MLWWVPWESLGLADGSAENSSEPSDVAVDVEDVDQHAEKPERCSLHIPIQELRSFDPYGGASWEDVVIKRWTCERPAEPHGLPEYAQARSLICLDSRLMRGSLVSRTLRFLETRRKESGRAPFRGTVSDVLSDFHEVFEPALLLALKKAFGLRTGIAARNEARAVPIVADHIGNFFDAALQMWASLPLWKKPIMSAALRELIGTEDSTGLQVLLGMMKASIQHCSAGKVDVWNRALLRVSPPATFFADDESVYQGAWDQVESPQASPTNSALRCPRARLWEAAFAFADDWKEKAFTSTFMEPTKMYYMGSGEPGLAENVEVHGASVYSAILLSTLGVRLPRLPFMLDTPISAVSFLDGLDSRQVEALWSSENIGKPYLSVPECRCPNVQHYVANHHSNFLFHGRQPWQIANNAVDSDGKAERRERLRPYVEQFARYFSRECIVMPLTQHLLAADETRSALQAVLDEMRSAATSGGMDFDNLDELDVRYWLWDVEVLPAEFRLERACTLLHSCGLLK